MERIIILLLSIAEIFSVKNAFGIIAGDVPDNFFYHFLLFIGKVGKADTGFSVVEYINVLFQWSEQIIGNNIKSKVVFLIGEGE